MAGCFCLCNNYVGVKKCVCVWVCVSTCACAHTCALFLCVCALLPVIGNTSLYNTV